MAKLLSLPSRLRTPALLLAAPAAALLALSPAMPSWSRAASHVVGIAAALVNDVRIKPASLTQFAQAKLRQRIALADQVRTGRDSRLQIALLDNTKVTVGPNAQLTIDKFVYDPNGGSVSLTAAKGALRFMSGSTNATRTVRTPAASIGIRGTIFDAAVGELAVEVAQRERAIPPGTQHDPATATLAVLRGPGPNRQGRAKVGAIDVDAGGQMVTLDRPLLAAYVPYAGATPIGPFTISLPGLSLLDNFILPPPPQGDIVPASEALPFPNREPNEPPPWLDPRNGPPPGSPGPGPGFGTPGGTGPGVPGLPGGFPGAGTPPPPRPARPAGNTVTPTPTGTATPAGTATPTATPPTRTPQPPSTATPPANNPPPTINRQQPPTRTPQTAPTNNVNPTGAAPQSQPTGKPTA